jgi:hypothetical protein
MAWATWAVLALGLAACQTAAQSPLARRATPAQTADPNDGTVLVNKRYTYPDLVSPFLPTRPQATYK